MEDFTDIVFSWSLEDIFNEDLYKNKVEKIPESFESVEQYHGSFLYPLLEETRAQVHSSMDSIDSAPFAQVVEFKKSNRQYKIKVKNWENRSSDGGKEPYKTLPWDLFVLANAKPKTVSDLKLAGRSWSFVSVTHLSQFVSNVSINDEDENAEDTCLRFEVVSSKECEVDESTSLFVVFLLNLIPNARIWKALHMSRNLDIIEQVLCFDSVGRENVHSEKNKDIMDKGLDESGLNESQTGAVLACLGMLQHRAKSAVELIWGPPGTGKTKTIATLLLTLLRMNCRTLICAPTNVAITEVASRILKMVTVAESNGLFCSLGKILLFGNKERLKLKKLSKRKVGSDIEEIYLGHRIQRLVTFLDPKTGWMDCFASMIKLLEDCVRDYNTLSGNELTEEREQNIVCEMKEESRSGSEVSEDKCKTFLEYFRDRFVSTALRLRHCICVFCTHMTKRCISKHVFEDMVSLIRLVDSFELLLFQGNVMSEAMENLFSCSEVEDVSESYVDDSIPLFMKRRECLLALRTLQYSLGKLQLPDFRNENVLMGLCFQSASLIFCTASSSFNLHRMEMEPFSIVIIDEAAQMKECESTIPLQLPGVKHVALFGDECQLPAMVQSNVSQKTGFARSLFERLSSVGHPKHLLLMQYRIHPSISFFPNSSFYDNRIQDAPNVRIKSYKKHYLPGAMFGPYSFININHGREEKDKDGHSRKNMVEVAVVLKLLQNLYKEWINSKQKTSVGVVSPYAAQVAAIQLKLGHKYDNLDGFKVKVKTIDGFQGGEEDIIIMSTVRTNSHQSLQFISNPQRVNVALTRARHCLWILGNERTLCNSESIWKELVLDARSRQCFFNADQHKDLAKIIVDAKKEQDQFNDLLNADSVVFKNARWKVLFSDNFLKSFKKLKSARLKKSALNLLLRLSSGWRPKHNVGTSCSSSSLILKKFKVEGLYIICTTDIAKDLLEKENWEDLRYIQILKVWDILPLENIPKLVSRLETISNRYTDDFINLCMEKYVEGNLEVPKSWPASMEFSRFKDPSVTETQSDLVGDISDGSSYVENSHVSESLLLMKFYALSSGVVNHLLSDREGRELDLPFEVTDQEMEIRGMLSSNAEELTLGGAVADSIELSIPQEILHHRSCFIVGRSGTGKTTVSTMKLVQKERWYHLAVQGCYDTENSKVEQSSATTDGKVLRQLFVTVSPKLCFAIKQQVLHLKSFACGGSDSTERSLIDMVDFDEEESQFKDIQNSFRDLPPSSYPLVITFHKFLMMLDGTLSNSYFARFSDAPLNHGQLRNSRSVAFQAFIRAKEVSYERFSSSYWPHFNTQLTKNLDISRVYTEIISHIKGGLGAIEACNGKLSRDDYVQLCEGRGSNLSKQKREVIYDIFQAYEKLKMGNGEFDLADFVIDLQRRLKHETYEGDQMDFIYIDEVQDLTMSQIALFKHMCSNVDEGFVFSGDTAQTIARGIDFRFQDIRHLFYKKFVLESRSNKHDKRKEKCKISEIYHLTQNFRTHAGILKFSQSIIDLLYRFFPLSIDVLKPESSLVYGEAPVVVESGENENAIIKIFGNSGRLVGFGAEQVILVRDDATRKEISNVVRKRALVLTIVECKGLEFQDVLLYNFFASSPLKNQWRIIYGYMMEQDLLDTTLPKKFPSFSEAKHNILCSELKQLYVAVTRTRQRLWICETAEEISKPMFDYWKKKCLVQVRQLDDSLAQAMQVVSSAEEWTYRGIKLYIENNYEMAAMCFERAGDTYWEQRCKASGLQAIAHRMRMSSPEEANFNLREAAEIFVAIGKADSAARCFSDLGDYGRAARIYLEKCGDSELERAAECFTLAGCYEDAAHVYAKGNFFSECLSVCAKGKLFEIGLKYINYWKRNAVEDSALTRRGEGIHKMVQEFLESGALHYHKMKDDRSMMKFVKAFHSILLMRNFLKNLGSLDELLLLEEEFGNYLEAAKIAKLKGEFLLESDLLRKAATIYLEKCGDSELERAAECFTLAGCYEDAAHVYAKGNFFSECLSVCAKGKLFEIGLKYINYWKRNALEDFALTRRGEGIHKMVQQFLESGALHYHNKKDDRSMMKFVKAFHSILLMRNFLKNLGSLDELLLLEEEYGNYLEAAEIAKLKGEFQLQSDFLRKAARIYLEKCGDSELERAAECFTLAGCYEDAARVYAKGNFFSECLSICAKGKLFEMGLEYINYWKRNAAEDSALTGEGIYKMVHEFLESGALHYHKKKDDRSMMIFVKAFHSILLMRNFLKSLGRLDELLLLEEEFGNYLEAAEIAQLKGEFLLESDFLGKAGEFKKASMHVLSYVLASSLWSSGSKGWPMKKFAQQEVLLRKSKSVAKNETDDFFELVCTEVEILLHGQDSLSVLKNQMKASQRHASIIGEVLSARKILDAHLSPRTDMYLWEKELIGDLVNYSEDMISKNQVSIESLVYFWNFWKEKIVLMIECLGCLESQEVNQNRSYQKFCLNYLGVWRLSHRMNPVYVLLFPDAEWVRDVDKSYFRRHGKLVSVDVHQLVSAAENYWSSELLSVGIEVLEKLDALYKFAIGSSDSTFFQSKALTLIYDVAIYLWNSKCLKGRYQDAKTLYKFVTSSTENFIAYMFPLDWRKSMRENMISLRRTDASKNVLHQVIVEYVNLKEELSSAQIGRIAMIILGSGKLNFKLCNKLVKKLECNPPWKDFIENLCASTGPGEELRKVTVMWRFFEALVETYNVKWRVVEDYITPGCFFYLVEHLLIWATCFQGYVITTSSCFTEWLMYQVEDTSLSSIVADVRSSIQGNEGILHFIINVVSECLCERGNLIEWIKKSNADWMSCYSLLVQRLIVLLCLLYVNFGMGLNILSDLLGRSYITEQLPCEFEQLPWEFYDTHISWGKHNSLNINVEVLAAALKKIDNTLVIASFGFDCSSFFCSDAIFVDMKANQCKDDIVRKMFPKPHVMRVAEGQIGSVETEAQYSKCNVM